MDSCDGCTTLEMYLMPLNCILKNAKMANFMSCKSCHGKKEWQTNYSSYWVENRLWGFLGVGRVGRSRRPAMGVGVLSLGVVEMMVPWTGVVPPAVERSGQIKELFGGRQLTWCVMCIGGDERGLYVTRRILSLGTECMVVLGSDIFRGK